MLRAAPALTLAVFLLPICAGLIGTALPAFGWLPAIGGHEWSLAPWRQLFAAPGIAASVALTITTGVAATAAALALTIVIVAALHDTRAFRRIQALLAPVLATPHAGIAIGLAFLIAPSGWIARALAPLAGWDRPPDWALPQDKWGFGLVAGLVVKEVPYLLLMTMAALNQIPWRAQATVARTLGYRAFAAWIKAVAPQVLPQLRLPIYAVLTYSLSTVDVALILGPNTPPPLSPLVVRWFLDRDLALYFPAAAGALLQLGIVVAAISVWRLAECAAWRLARPWIARGGRGRDAPWRIAGGAAALTIGGANLLALATLLAWSFAASWRFPEILPSSWTSQTWMHQADALADPLVTTIAVACVATLAALALVIACLENERRRHVAPGAAALWLLYLPLLIPQSAFLFGVQTALVRLDLDGSFAALVWAHLLFVLPYVFLSLADPWRALDPRLARSAAALGVTPGAVLRRVVLPIMLRPILAAFAVGFAVSVGQYLPTLFAGAGRYATLTTEAVTLASGGDRRVVGVFAFVQSVLPLVVYALALAAPALLWRHRRGLRV
jgi:putative thiamine transport system permease protein